jgi:hypothetical protein
VPGGAQLELFTSGGVKNVMKGSLVSGVHAGHEVAVKRAAAADDLPQVKPQVHLRAENPYVGNLPTTPPRLASVLAPRLPHAPPAASRCRRGERTSERAREELRCGSGWCPKAQLGRASPHPAARVHTPADPSIPRRAVEWVCRRGSLLREAVQGAVLACSSLGRWMDGPVLTCATDMLG